jgi:hypothetical protein
LQTSISEKLLILRQFEKWQKRMRTAHSVFIKIWALHTRYKESHSISNLCNFEKKNAHKT